MKFKFGTIFAAVTKLICGGAVCLLAGCSNISYTNIQEVSAPLTSLTERAQAIHRDSLVLDAHADIVLPSTSSSYLGEDGLSKVHPAKLSAGGMDAVVMSVAVGPGPRTPAGNALARAEADKKIAAISHMIKVHDTVKLANTPAEVRAIRGAGKTALILGFQNARSLGGDVTALNEFYAAGVRVFGLNHMGHNDFSDSSRPLFNAKTAAYEATQEHGGLSPLGVSAIKRINSLGAVIDVSQMSKAATLQVLKLTRAPVIASHSNVRQLSDVSRNLSDEEIDLIGKNGGVIHIAAFGAYLADFSDPQMLASIKKVRISAGLPEAYSYPYELYWEIADPEKRRAFLLAMREVIGTGSVDRLIDHIDYITARIGIEHVGIGSDFNHGGGVEGFVDAGDALNITAGLVRRGYSAQQIKKIWGENFLRVFEEAQHRASPIE